MCLALLAAGACTSPGTDTESSKTEDNQKNQLSYAQVLNGAVLYAEHCASCHGRDLGGGLGSALVKSEWMYGRDSFSFEINIRNGIPSAAMPAFGDVLEESDILALVDFLVFSQSSSSDEAKPIPNTITTPTYRLEVERLVDAGLNKPWGIEFVDASRALITENSGKLFWLVDGELDPTPIEGVPQVDLATSTGGLLDLAIDPEYDENGLIYLAYSKSADANDVQAPGMTQVLRARVEDYNLVDAEIIYSVPEEFHRPNSKHWGGRMLVGADGYLYFSIGDMSQPEESQDPGFPTGKIHRIRMDGSIPADNPFVENGEIAATVYSLGNRNVQGLTQHPTSLEIWSTEHGPHGGDELNIIKRGANYGWPVTTYGVNYDGSMISELTEKEGIESPIKQWTPALAISATSFVTSGLFPEWEDDLLVGSLSREALLRLEIENNEVVKETVIFKDFGRIRDVKFSPDGSLYILFNSPGMVARFTPAAAD